MSADFNFYINRQGARGRQGIQGEPGFSPVVTVNTDTDAAYILNIETSDGVLTTPNLKSTPLNYIEGAGNYVMYDPSTRQIYNSDVPDELVLRTDLATTENPGIIQIADSEDISESATDVAINPKQLNDAIAGVEGDIPTDYVDITTNQTVGGIKTFTDGLASDDTITLNNGATIEFKTTAATGQEIVLSKMAGGFNLLTTQGSVSAKLLNELDVDGTTVWINNQGRLSARGEDFPDVIDGGLIHSSPLGTYTFSVTSGGATLEVNPVNVTSDGAARSDTILFYDTASKYFSFSLVVNADYTIDFGGGTYSELDPQTGRWITKQYGSLEDFLTENTTTTTLEGVTFSIDWDTHVITIHD